MKKSLQLSGNYYGSETHQILDDLEGENVGVWAGPGENRNDFDLKICASGILERHKKDRDSFRVVFSEGNFAYFDRGDVYRIVVNPRYFKDGTIAAIKLKNI
jgi:hypothetical protein